MQFRTGTMDDVAMLWALRTRCVRETCSSHYPPEVIAPGLPRRHRRSMRGCCRRADA